VSEHGHRIAHSVLSEAPRPDRGFGRGLCVGLILSGLLYLAVFLIVAWLT